MAEENNVIEKIAIRYGLIAFAGLTAYFLFMKMVGLFEIHELRSLNFFILFAAIWRGLTYQRKNGHLSYFEGIALGSLIALIAVIPFALFIFFYLQIDTPFMSNIITNEAFGQFLNPYILAFLIAFEGGISGVLVSFGMMQYLKKSSLVSAT